jgi:uncharacterized protein YdiU (UPF0061 family)
MSAHFRFDNSYATLPAAFFARVTPAAVPAPLLIKLNRALAAELQLDPDRLDSPEGALIFAGQQLPEGAEPIAMAYAGHQFGQFVPQLGDGRAILLGELIDRHGQRRDIQLKGSGRTPFSRSGDGRAALGPVLREYIVSEAMAALGIPTTRALAAVLTGDTVLREALMPGAVLTRVASSHIRVGTFQYFAARGDQDGVKALADHVIERHYPSISNSENKYLALLNEVTTRQAELIARWLLVGFIHGVMNTDNTSIAGETIDYGPCAFMDAYHPGTVFSSIDQMGRYAFGNQPQMALWNLARLAECLVPLLAPQQAQDQAIAAAQAVLGRFSSRFNAAYDTGLRRKLGLFSERDEDKALIQDLLALMTANQADFTLTFRALCTDADNPDPGSANAQFLDRDAYRAWAARWQARLTLEPEQRATRQAAMRAVNPAFIPRNHRIQAVIDAGIDGDFAPFEELLTVLTHPFDDQPQFAHYADPPMPHERVLQTFCGT